MIKSLAIIITCFNRKNMSLACLESLWHQHNNLSIDVFLCDDGSTDGTYEAVTNKYPQVHIYRGTGNLFWNRGMLFVWEKAVEYADFDAYLWMNDDVQLKENALQMMVEESSIQHDKAIICGAFCNKNGDFTYGGRQKNGSPIIPNGLPQPVYWLNGNCVLIPRSVVKKIGLLDKLFHHHLGDYDYGLRAIEAGINVLSSTSYVGECNANPLGSSRNRKMGCNLCQRFKYLYSPLGSNPRISFVYNYRHFGFLHAVYLYIAVHLNNILSDKAYMRKNKIIYEES